MSSPQHTGHFHPLPVVGHPDAFYVKQILAAESAGDVHAREAAKVGRYLTFAVDPGMSWEEKLRHFLHALKRHSIAPPGATPEVALFYQRLAELVRRHASQEAMRFVAHETEPQRLRGQIDSPEALRDRAGELRHRLFGDAGECPRWMTSEAWERINRKLKEMQGVSPPRH